MSRENTRWGAPRIHGELLKLGFSISQAAVSKYMVRYPSPPSQSWRTFLTNHADCLASIDFFVVPTATFHLLFGFIVLHHERRQIVHFGVTANPTMAWVAQQIREAFPWGTAPRYLIRDRDGAYGQSFRSTVTAMGVEEVVTAPRSPWQNPYVERLIGSVRRECLDHSIILNERHLRRILGSYLDYYHGSRTHLSLGKDTPDGRPVQPAGSGTVVSLCPSHLYHLSQKPWNFASPPDTLSGMHKIIEIFADRAALHTEILALRQQVSVLKRQWPRPSLRKADRVFWVILSCLWPGWRHALVIVRPETVIGWHRKGFRLFWTWKWRRGKPGRPPVSREIRYLVRRMSRENTRWGAPRIHGELLKLGFSISQAAVSKYMVRYPSPPSQSWRTFLTNHADCLASIDFFVVPTATFHLLFGFIVLHHERRQIVHFGVTANPTMAWVAQQIREAFPWGTAPRYLIRDRDGAYGQSFRSTVTAMGVEEVVTAPRSPWQNPYVERLIGSVRRECLDHSIILNERHLRRILGSYLDYYHGSRTHLSLGKDTPDGRPVQPAGSGTVVSLPKVGGLHHRYERLAA